MPGKIEMFARRVADYEGQQKADECRNRKSSLEESLARLRDRKKAYEQKLADSKKDIDQLQARGCRIAELMLEIWPSPADLDD